MIYNCGHVMIMDGGVIMMVMIMIIIMIVL